MNQIQIDELSPGEAVLSAEKVVEYRQALERGELLDPVHIYKVNDKWVIRDGNNRVRAYIEHCRANGILTDTITCTPSTAPAPGPAAFDGLCRVSCYYGQGVDAFVRIPLATSADYEAMQTTVGQQIMQTDSINSLTRHLSGR